MTAPVILIDCDGVLADFVGAFLTHVKNPPASYDYAFSGMDTKAAFAAARAPGFCASLQPLPGAKEGIDLLRHHAEIVVVTAPMIGSPTWVHERMEWLDQHFGLKTSIHTHHKHHVTGHLLIDDHPVTVKSWEAAHKRPGVLWAAHHNIGHQRRHQSWETVLGMLYPHDRAPILERR